LTKVFHHGYYFIVLNSKRWKWSNYYVIYCSSNNQPTIDLRCVRRPAIFVSFLNYWLYLGP